MYTEELLPCTVYKHRWCDAKHIQEPPFSPKNILGVLLFLRYLAILHSGMWDLNSLARG